jgi:hypothetical protein
MEYLKRFFSALAGAFSWWFGKIASNKGRPMVAGLWLVGGLCGICMVCSMPLSVISPDATPTPEAVAAVAPVEVASQSLVPVAPSEPDVEPSATEEPTPPPEPTATSVPATATTVPPTQTPAPTATTAPTATAEPTATPVVATALVTADSLRVRAGPGSGGEVIGSLSGGATVTALGYVADRSWIQVSLPDGGEGWVMAQFVELTNDQVIEVLDVPIVEAPPTPIPQAAPVAPAAPAGGNCHPSYPDVCIPPAPPDLNCGDVPYKNFRVLPPDPHRFDGNKDGWGCER